MTRIRKTAVTAQHTLLVAGAIFFFVFCCTGQTAVAAESSCLTCHSNPDFASSNKKLRDYFLRWEKSYHADAGIGCVDCHGGNPDQADKKNAHAGGEMFLNFTEIPATCGKCHKSIYASFIKSYHYKYQAQPDSRNMHGANCVTCHFPGDSYVTMETDPREVEKACAFCHNAQTRNFPEIPAQARQVLGKFNEAKKQFSSFMIRTEFTPSREFLASARKKVSELSLAWHTFDLRTASAKTDEVLQLFKKKRKVLRKAMLRNSRECSSPE